MTIDLYTYDPGSLKKALARFYDIQLEPGKRLMIPGVNDTIFVNIHFRRGYFESLAEVTTFISQAYWQDRLEFKYDGLTEELIRDLWRPGKYRHEDPDD